MSEQAPQEPVTQGEQAILSQMQQFRDECLHAVTLCRAEILAQVRQTMWLNHTLSKLTQEVKELREQLMKDRLFLTFPIHEHGEHSCGLQVEVP